MRAKPSRLHPEEMALFLGNGAGTGEGAECSECSEVHVESSGTGSRHRGTAHRATVPYLSQVCPGATITKQWGRKELLSHCPPGGPRKFTSLLRGQVTRPFAQSCTRRGAGER